MSRVRNRLGSIERGGARTQEGDQNASGIQPR